MSVTTLSSPALAVELVSPKVQTKEHRYRFLRGRRKIEENVHLWPVFFSGEETSNLLANRHSAKRMLLNLERLHFIPERWVWRGSSVNVSCKQIQQFWATKPVPDFRVSYPLTT